MTTREFYESIGASYDSVLVRFGSEKMITKFAKRFADDTTFQDMCKALEEKKRQGSFPYGSHPQRHLQQSWL